MNTEMKAGMFVLVALASLVYMTTRLTQNRFSFLGTKRYYAQIADATGLLTKTKVKMAGLDVGQLEGLELAGKHARAVMQIASDITIHKDATISVKSIGFLGDKYIELHPGSEQSPMVAEGSELAESMTSGGIDQLTQKTSEVLENIKEITLLLKDALKGNEGEEDTRLDRILDNMESFSESLASLDKIGDLADRLTQVATNIRDITDKVKRGEGTVGKLLNDSETVDKINTTLSGVNKFLTKADKLQVAIDAHTGILANTGGSKSNVSLILQPTYDKYYLLGVTSSPRGVSSTTTTTSVNNPGQPTSTTSVTQETRLNETTVSFNAQFAKRFGDLTFRLGLFESTGGLALDYNFMDDKVKLVSEIYRFRTGDRPQWNTGVEAHLFRPFYLWVGGEDLVNRINRNFLIGAGIRFTDQDIKSLVAAAVSGR